MVNCGHCLLVQSVHVEDQSTLVTGFGILFSVFFSILLSSNSGNPPETDFNFIGDSFV
jgi:hypothetical protein